MPGGSDIINEIIGKLDKNGDLNEDERDHYIVLLLIALVRRTEPISEIKDRIEELEDNSIVLIAKKHPKISLPFLAFCGIIVASMIARLEMWGWIGAWIAKLIGLPIP